MRANCEPGGETEENMSKIMDRMKELEAEYIEIRRAIHQHPETAFEEKETTELVVRELERYGIEVFRNGEDTGAVGVLRGALPGKTVALRADIDALPMQEETGFPLLRKFPAGAMPAVMISIRQRSWPRRGSSASIGSSCAGR